MKATIESLAEPSEEELSEEEEVEEMAVEKPWIPLETKSVELQEAFQSTSTSKYLESRFLLWNSIGTISSYNEQIQISFHDVSFHHTISIDNKTEKYSLADLSLSAIVLGSTETNQCRCLLYQSWDSEMKEWSINFEKNEKILLVRLTEDYLAVATSERLIRLFSLAGIQQRLIRIHGPIVCLSSHRNHLWIIEHACQGLPKEQAMSTIFIDLDEDSFQTFPIPLTPKSKLIWTGFVLFILQTFNSSLFADIQTVDEVSTWRNPVS